MRGKMEVEEKKNEEAAKTNIPPLASLELFKATSVVIFVLEQDPI